MWLFNPPDATAQPTRSGLRSDGAASGFALMLPPAWQINVTAGVITFPTEGVTATTGSIRRYWDFVPPGFPADIYDKQVWEWSAVPTTGTFRVVIEGIESDPVPLSITDTELAELISTLFADAGLPGVTVEVQRSKSLISFTLGGGAVGFFPLIDVSSNLTSGGTFWTDAMGPFVLGRRLKYATLPFAVPPANLTAEWADSPFLYDYDQPTWFVCPDVTDTAWPYYYQLTYGHWGGSETWALLMSALERTGTNRDFVYWTLRADELGMFAANRPDVFGGKRVMLNDPEVGAPENTGVSVLYEEFPQELILTPYWW